MITPASSVLAIFDVCDTLYAANTTRGLLETLASGQSAPEVGAQLARWTERTSPFFYLGAAAQRLGHDLARNRLVRALAGLPRPLIEEAGRTYVRNGLPKLANTTLHSCLEEHRAKGHRIVLLSNSLDAVVAPIAHALEVEYRASELEYRGDVCTGALRRDLTARKASLLEELTGGSHPQLYVYTDNRSDSDLLEAADFPVLVLSQQRRIWGKPEWKKIRV